MGSLLTKNQEKISENSPLVIKNNNSYETLFRLMKEPVDNFESKLNMNQDTLPKDENYEHNNSPDVNIQYKPSVILPYRLSHDLYEKIDKVYAIKIKADFNNLPLNIKQEFNHYTKNLMEDEYINRFKLLNAIVDFSIKYNDICNNESWANFSIIVFNYKPSLLFEKNNKSYKN